MRTAKCMQVLGFSLGVLFMSASARAEGYWGFGIGEASLDLKPGFGAQAIEDSPMLKLIFGSRTIDQSIELDISLGVFDWTGTRDGSHTVANISVSGLAFMPIGEASWLFGKIGANLSTAAAKFQGTVFQSDVGLGITYGGGLIFDITETFALRAEYQVTTGISDGVDNGNLDWFSVQAVFSYY